MKYCIRLFLFAFFNVTAMNVYAQNQGNGNPSNPGSMGTSSANPLSMVGWHVDSKPMIPNPKREIGKVVYTIEIDSLGNLLTIKILEQTITDELAEKCEDEIRKIDFIRNLNNTSTAATTKGSITFIFRVD